MACGADRAFAGSFACTWWTNGAAEPLGGDSGAHTTSNPQGPPLVNPAEKTEVSGEMPRRVPQKFLATSSHCDTMFFSQYTTLPAAFLPLEAILDPVDPFDHLALAPASRERR